MNRILIAGAGALGSAIAVVLAQAGLEVIVVDPAPLGENASGVAAGMLAPAFEAVLDPAASGHFGLLRAARDLWPDFEQRLGGRGIGLHQSGALWIDATDISSQKQIDLRAAFASLGASVEVRVQGLFTAEDWRLDPALALAAMRSAADGADAEVIRAEVLGFENGSAILSNGQRIQTDQVVLATGANLSRIAPESRFLTPILGQILTFPNTDGLEGAPALRWAGGYAVQSARGLVVGATMEPGRQADPMAAHQLRASAVARFPQLADVVPVVRTGVRAATSDGLPLVGPSGRPGVFLAAGARRNGWLLAPLVAKMTAAYLAGDNAGSYAAAMDARRFNET